MFHSLSYRAGATLVFLLVSLWVSGSVAAEPSAVQPAAVSFQRDVRPILANHCFACHGRDEARRQAELALDDPASATMPTPSGAVAIRPGMPDESELIRRIFSADDAVRMPPPEAEKPLSQTQKDVLRQWVAQGAPYQAHWAFTPPTRPPLPVVSNRAWLKNPIDTFIGERHEEAGIAPSPEADRATLIRRLALDLTGLPPSPAEVAAFVASQAPDAYELLVDRLLASPRYGEHMARYWLDAARYADTHGYFTDHIRFMWRWREWVIQALNGNMPYDRFTIEQLAGDLLPAASIDQQIASGFNRNHMITEETGVIPEEYRVEYVLDRVRTTSAVWLGLTLGCAQCHDHKYDPFTQRDFYRFYAYFNQVTDDGISGGKKNAPPLLRLPTAEQSRALTELDSKIAMSESLLASLPEEHPANAAQRTRVNGELTMLRQQHQELLASVDSTMVMQDGSQPRETFVLVRGQYDQPGERVETGVPERLHALPEGAEPNRLGLARWLVAPGHPLTARVAVNRLWQQLFGAGIVATSEDFGIQGDPPSHPELLDWLSEEFVVSGWDVKSVQRLIVTSATYRQSSARRTDHDRIDPANRLLSRSPRYRLDAEVLRDVALAASGLLVERLGGASVMPYQPEGIWKDVVYDRKNTQTYEQDHGAGLYRRSMYTYWKRQVPPPSLLVLDAPTRETCVLRRQRTNTPLQGLVLLNDPQFVECARALAQRALRQAQPEEAARLRYTFCLATAREPTAGELATLAEVLHAQRAEFDDSPELAEQLLSVGESQRDPQFEAAELAAWTVVANLVLNLDEAISRE